MIHRSTTQKASMLMGKKCQVNKNDNTKKKFNTDHLEKFVVNYTRICLVADVLSLGFNSEYIGHQILHYRQKKEISLSIPREINMEKKSTHTTWVRMLSDSRERVFN